jgi:ribosomal protein L13E
MSRFDAARAWPVTVHGRDVALAEGYSLYELERVGLTEAGARALGLPVDTTRSTLVGSNILQLRQLLS